ncbi:MAG: hypothetical protein GX265_06540 [Mollicutes bacterium]|nr:hypothetical protein [Mollicutes bacterium]
MILKPNYNNDTEYRFILLYDENINKYNLNYKLFIEDTDITCKFINKDLENKIIEAILNRLNITYNNSNIDISHEIIIDNEDDLNIDYNIERQYLRFFLQDVGLHYKIEEPYLDNKILSINEYKYIFDVGDNINLYSEICEAINENKYQYIPKLNESGIDDNGNSFESYNSIIINNISYPKCLIFGMEDNFNYMEIDNNMMSMRLNVKDVGNMYEVISINDAETTILGHVNNTYEIFSWSIYELICQALMEGKTIYLPKNNYSQLTVDDIVIVEQESELETQKKIAINKVKDFLYSTRINKLQLLDYYTFTILNNYFINMGFAITYQNREEKYLEIITAISEMEDENEAEIAIANLENYLNILDKLKELEGFVVRLNTTIDEIISCETVEAVETVVNDFLDFFK